MATNTVEYFPLSQLHQEIDDTLIGAVRFNTDQNLSDSEKAQARENIGAVSFGSNLKILGHFDTVTELQASAPQNIGDAYSVGTATPYNLYIFDGLRNEWLDYGQIRAADISSRYVENQVIAVSAWTQDETALAGYSYKAQITVSGATGDDFPIVAFDQSDAVSGNYAPLSFSFDGYIEIWAKTKPTAAVTIPIATIIVNGGNGRGITNATGGIAAGSIKTADLADGSVVASKMGNGVVTRAKLADDALYSPNVYVSASRKIQASDLGKKLFASGANNNCVLTLDDATSAEFAIGTEIFFGWVNASSPLSIKFSGVNFILKGSKEVNTSAKDVTVKLVEQGSAASIIKYSNVTSTSNSRWFLTGDVEVVS